MFSDHCHYVADCRRRIESVGRWPSPHRRVDEVGRGCWAGPVVAAAVVLPQAVLDRPICWPAWTTRSCSRHGSAPSSARASWISRMAGVSARSRRMSWIRTAFWRPRVWPCRSALIRLPRPADALLIDACAAGALALPTACADQRRCALPFDRGGLGGRQGRARPFDGRAGPAGCRPMASRSHKGYGTAAHERALCTQGPSPQHRRSFRPLADFLGSGEWRERVAR